MTINTVGFGIATKDNKGREYAKSHEVTVGTVLEPDNEFTCMRSNVNRQPVRRTRDTGELYVNCTNKRHYISAQLNNEGTHYIGFYKVEA